MTGKTEAEASQRVMPLDQMMEDLRYPLATGEEKLPGPNTPPGHRPVYRDLLRHRGASPKLQEELRKRV